MAPPDPPIAEAHVAIGIMPAFFAENPRQWFQTAEAQFATARPAPNNGQKYFHLLQKLPAEIMNNCSDYRNMHNRSILQCRRPIHSHEIRHLGLHTEA